MHILDGINCVYSGIGTEYQSLANPLCRLTKCRKKHGMLCTFLWYFLTIYVSSATKVIKGQQVIRSLPLAWPSHTLADRLLTPIGNVTLVAITKTTILVPYHYYKSLQLIGLATHRWNLQVPDLQMSCRDLTTWQGTRILVPEIATRVTYLINTIILSQDKVQGIHGLYVQSTSLVYNTKQQSISVNHMVWLMQGSATHTKIPWFSSLFLFFYKNTNNGGI